MKKICVICQKEFVPETNRSIYCSEECRKQGRLKTQRELMKKKRQPKNVEKTDSQNANLDSGNRPKKKRNLLQHYQKLKKDLLANEEQFGFKGLYLVEGIDIHEENFEQLIIEKIKERK